MTRYSVRYSDRYSGARSVAVGNARQDVDVARDVDVDVAVDVAVDVTNRPPQLTRTPKGVLVSENPYPTLSVVKDELKFESQLQTARGFDSVVPS